MAFVHLEDLQGSIDVVVFPRVYAATRDLWQEDKILIVRGRVDADRGALKILCDTVQDYLVTAHPAADDQGVPAALPPARPAHADAGPAPEPVPPPHPVPAAAQKTGHGAAAGPAAAKNGSGNGAGRPGNGRGKGATRSLPAPSPVTRLSPVPPRHVELILRRTGDLRLDTQRARAAYGLLVDSQGSDTFAFMVESEKGRVRIDFPNHTIQWSPDLAASLSAVLGRDAVQIRS
jgi:DNA polymerase-3 subunit alpha